MPGSNFRQNNPTQSRPALEIGHDETGSGGVAALAALTLSRPSPTLDDRDDDPDNGSEHLFSALASGATFVRGLMWRVSASGLVGGNEHDSGSFENVLDLTKAYRPLAPAPFSRRHGVRATSSLLSAPHLTPLLGHPPALDASQQLGSFRNSPGVSCKVHVTTIDREE
jgi:hypothetical protein